MSSEAWESIFKFVFWVMFIFILGLITGAGLTENKYKEEKIKMLEKKDKNVS